MNARLRPLLRPFLCPLLVSLLTACGGGGGGNDSWNSGGSDDSDDVGSFGGSVSIEKRISAAEATAASNSACTAIEPFYWEIGDGSDRIAGKSEGDGSVLASTDMKIASASKWIFGAYVLEKRGNVPTDEDIKALTMRTGYSNFRYGLCIEGTEVQQDTLTVLQCFEKSASGGANDDYVAGDDGKFNYNGGHFQHWATQNGLEDEINSSLAIELGDQFGNAFQLDFDSPQLAGGMYMNALNYAFFLRSILSDDLYMHDRLGTEAVCTNLADCPDTATYTPIPDDEAWHYSLGHWVEDDPAVGDGAFSSPGYFGFYPWIDANKKWYGIVARGVEPGNLLEFLFGDTAMESVACGRKIRKAWLSGQQQN